MAKTSKNSSQQNDDTHSVLLQILDELSMIKRLMLTEQLRNGVSQSNLADALGVSQPTVSRMLAPSKQVAARKTRSR